MWGKSREVLNEVIQSDILKEAIVLKLTGQIHSYRSSGWVGRGKTQKRHLVMDILTDISTYQQTNHKVAYRVRY